MSDCNSAFSHTGVAAPAPGPEAAAMNKITGTAPARVELVMLMLLVLGWSIVISGVLRRAGADG